MKTLLSITLVILVYCNLNAQNEHGCKVFSSKGPYPIAYAHPDSGFQQSPPSTFAPGDSVVYIIGLDWQHCEQFNEDITINTNMAYNVDYDQYYATTDKKSVVYDEINIPTERICGLTHNSYYSCSDIVKTDYVIIKDKLSETPGTYYVTYDDYRGTNLSKGNGGFRVVDQVLSTNEETTALGVSNYKIYDSLGNHILDTQDDNYTKNLEKGKMYIVKTQHPNQSVTTKKVTLY